MTSGAMPRDGTSIVGQGSKTTLSGLASVMRTAFVVGGLFSATAVAATGAGIMSMGAICGAAVGEGGWWCGGCTAG